jgi:D-alanyl-D-alanine carboxypeptidase (penicillin-binding protein 5/6)
MLSTTHLPPHARTAARTVTALLVAAAMFGGPAAVASTVTSPPAGKSAGSTTPTVSHSPRPVVSPWAGPLTMPCPPSAATHPSPAITDPPSALPPTPTNGPIGGPLLGSSGIAVQSAAGVPATPDITASSWVIADADTGEVLAAKDPHGRFLPASTLKTLTAVTLIPRLDPCQIYVATKKDLHAECTCAGVADGTAYRIRMLFTGMLIYSGNDAANTLAGAYGGIDKTVTAMNAEAKYLKAYDTEAGTPSGLDTPGERSSAYDLALIARAGLAMPDFRSYVSTRHVLFTMPHGETQTLFTHVKLLPNYDGAIGIKNGFTVAAQATYVGAATRNGHTIIATLMHSTVGTAVWHEDAALLDWGFAAVGKVTPVGELVSPDLPPLPSAPGSSATASSSAASLAASSGFAAPTSVLKAVVKASDIHKASASGSSVAVPLTIAGVVAVGAGATLASLQRRRRRRVASLEKSLRF